ncbi:MAG TPA: aminotransferase class I/II-fold pyridoxal phosphate-dependent enzyme [Vicinamibacteria bacterium]|jgi:cystathionine beta-lyase/cystathionine gamma-synthase|nr:aminotransferase class I/II-fold pyridoxal phosphate-dependent enzyme [Vicinamibacteria bacterium]
MSKRGIGTRAVRGGREARPGPLTTPIVQSSTFAFASAAEMRRYLEGDEELYLYTRYENPTLRELEQSLATLEEGEAGLVFASGMAAITTAIFSLVKAGDEVLASASLYGGTTRFVREVLPTLGVTGQLIPPSRLTNLEGLAGPRSRVLVIESPTNPSLDVLDIGAVASAAHDRGLALIVDNTFATPCLQRPLAQGADFVMHSLTKALGGHSDIIGGALVGSRARIEGARSLLKVLGGCLDPHAAFLVLRGLKTLHLRVERQCANALALARRLEGHPKLSRVRYPGLPSHPAHEVARRQMSAFGGMVSIVLKGGLPAAECFYDHLRLVTRAASLGGVESLVSLPVHTSHHGYSDEQLRSAGVDPGSARISLGVEDAEDIIADIEQALDAVP